MPFQVHTPSGVEDYTGGARYQVELTGGGVLAVWADDGRKVVYGADWLAPPRPHRRPCPTDDDTRGTCPADVRARTGS